MIRFTLSCDNAHQFESWFKSNAAFETLQTRGLISCETCGSTKIEKTLMAPAVPRKDLQTEKIAALKKDIETNAEYVGDTFYAEARAMHDGEKPERAIYGQANFEQAKSLLKDGVPVLPLPFVPKKRTN